MGLVVQIRGKAEGKVRRFEDDQELIVFGRDPAQCDVVFAEGATVVGREHCALKRVLGRYRLVLNGDNRVFLDGKSALDDQELPAECELQLGPNGPRMRIRRLEAGDLPDTKEQGHQKGQATMIVEAHAATRRNQLLSAAALVALAIGTFVVIQAFQDTDEKHEETQKDVEQTRSDVAGTRERIEVLTGKVGSLESGLGEVAGMRDVVASMKGKLTTVEGELERLGPRLAAGLEKARASVYLVLFRTPDGLEQGGATAWVVGNGMLATNAHVAEKFGRLSPGVEMLVRSPDATPKTFQVKHVRIHPGYSEFDDVWSGYRPVQGTSLANSVPVSTPGACDVAVLTVDDPQDQLAPPLVLASTGSLQALGAGDVVGFVGYPMENMVLTGTPVTRPSPQTQTGHVTALTDYFGVSGDPRESYLVQHSCPAGGGASGSPVLNADGEVIAVLSGGNVVRVMRDVLTSTRVSSGVDINFAQRVDLLREVLDDRAGSVQPDRARAWHKAIERLFASGYLMERDQTIEGTLSRLASLLQQQSGHRNEYAWTEGFKSDGVADGQQSVSLDLPTPGTYALIASAGRAREFTMRATVHATGTPNWDLPEDSVAPYLRCALFTTAVRGQVEVTASGPDDELPVGFRLYQARESALLPDTLRQQLLNGWESVLKAASGRAYDIELSAQGDTTLDANRVFNGHTTELPAGEYLASVISKSKQDVDFSIARQDDRTSLGEDRDPDYFPTVQFRLASPGVVDISIVGPAAGLEVEVRFFRAVERQ